MHALSMTRVWQIYSGVCSTTEASAPIRRHLMPKTVQLLDTANDAEFMLAWAAYANELYDAAGQMAALITERAKSGRPPNLYALGGACLRVRDLLHFAMRKLD